MCKRGSNCLEGERCTRGRWTTTVSFKSKDTLRRVGNPRRGGTLNPSCGGCSSKGEQPAFNRKGESSILSSPTTDLPRIRNTGSAAQRNRLTIINSHHSKFGCVARRSSSGFLIHRRRVRFLRTHSSGSFNGRTRVSETLNVGSSPTPGTSASDQAHRSLTMRTQRDDTLVVWRSPARMAEAVHQTASFRRACGLVHWLHCSCSFRGFESRPYGHRWLRSRGRAPHFPRRGSSPSGDREARRARRNAAQASSTSQPAPAPADGTKEIVCNHAAFDFW